jgi:hypothetical protein
MSMRTYEFVYIPDHILISCCRHRKWTLALQLVKETHHYSEENKVIRLWSMTRRGRPHWVNSVIKQSVISIMCIMFLCCVSMLHIGC